MRCIALLSLVLLALVACDSPAPDTRCAPLLDHPDPRDQEALDAWEREGGDPAPHFLHRYPAPTDERGAYPIVPEQTTGR